MVSKPQANAVERRIFSRQLVSSRVKLVHSMIGALDAVTRDISDSGVFVKIHPVPKLPVGAHVKMHMLDSRQPDIAFNMKVVRATAEGLGLLFIDYELNGERYGMDVLRRQLRKKK